MTTRVAVIGAGNWGKNLVKNFSELGVLESVAEVSPVLREGIRKTYPRVTVHEDYREVLKSGVEAIAIATPVPTHHAIAKEALLAGKDVFVEKPLALSVAESQELVNIAKERKRILMVGHLLLFQPSVQKIKAAIQGGVIGKLKSLHQERLNLGKARKVENALWSLGVHDVAVLLHLAGEGPSRVLVTGQRVLQPKVEDDVYLHMEFPGGFQAHLHNSWLWPVKQRGLTVIGTEGMLVYDEATQKVILHKKGISPELQNIDRGEEVFFEGSAEPLKIELSHFLECVAKRSEPLASGEKAVDVVRVLEKATHLLEPA